MRRFICLAVWLLLTIGCGKDDARDTATPVPPDVVRLDTAQERSAGIAVDTVRRLPPDTFYLTGTMTFDAGRVSHVGPRTSGRIRRVYVDIGTRVRAGDTLALLDSPELGAAQARWAQARANRGVAVRNAERAERLFRDGVVSERRRLETAAELASREAELAAEAQALSALGAVADSGAGGLFVLRSPLDGEVVEKHAVAGEVVGSESALFIVGELNKLWLLLDLYETDIGRVRNGLPVQVRADAYPDRVFRAEVTLVSAVVDTTSRTIKVRVEIQNAGHELKPGMFARAGIAIDDRAGAIGIPHAAVQSVNGEDVVFVPAGRGEYRTRRVTLGSPRAGGWVEVVRGLSRGEAIVVSGSFGLKAHMLRASFGEES